VRFRTTIELGGKTATGFEVPTEVVEALGKSRRPAVSVTINGYTYRTTVAVMGGRFMVPLSAENRSGAKAAAGDEVDVDMEVDQAPREVEVPADLAAALESAGARARFDALAFSYRKEHARAVEDAKTDETRRRRIAKIVASLQSSDWPT
jgi:uncharacterized protein DUF1905/bacteriocin resistance YdeI/OmpD-like protein